MEYKDYWDAYHQTGRFLEDVHMHKRIPSALDYLIPIEFEVQWLEQRFKALVFSYYSVLYIQIYEFSTNS